MSGFRTLPTATAEEALKTFLADTRDHGDAFGDHVFILDHATGRKLPVSEWRINRDGDIEISVNSDQQTQTTTNGSKTTKTAEHSPRKSQPALASFRSRPSPELAQAMGRALARATYRRADLFRDEGQESL